TRSKRDWSSDVCSSDLNIESIGNVDAPIGFCLIHRPSIVQSARAAGARDGHAQCRVMIGEFDRELISERKKIGCLLRLVVRDARSEERRVGNEGRSGWG